MIRALLDDLIGYAFWGVVLLVWAAPYIAVAAVGVAIGWVIGFAR